MGPISNDRLTEVAPSEESDLRYWTALDNFDQLSSHEGADGADTAMDIVGVLADIKPASIIPHRPILVDLLDKLGVSHTQIVYDDEIVFELAISKNPDFADELAKLYSKQRKDDDDQRRIGSLLGYPKTATEYYVERTHSYGSDDLPIIEPKSLLYTTRGEFIQLILSRGHWRQEIEEYIAPLEDAFRELMPKTYKQMERRVRRKKFFEGVMRAVRIRPSVIFSNSTSVEYVG